MSLSPAVLAEIQDRFAGADISTVVGALEVASGPSVPEFLRFGPRVQMAIIKLAGGDLAKFREALADAERDWRDVLVASGLGGENWREVLAQSGMRVP